MINFFKKLLEPNSTERQVFNYLFVGVWNTFFGIGLYTLLISILGEKHYLLLSIISNVISITNAYFCYKFFVFKTKGNYLKEYFKCYLVYGVSVLAGLFLMYLAVDIVGLKPIFSNIVITLFLCVISFLGHKFFSFRQKKGLC